MESVYERAQDLQEKVESIMLKKIEWRILFSVDGQRSVSDIADKVGRDEDFVNDVLTKLEGESLVETSSDAAAPKAPKKKKSSRKKESKKKPTVAAAAETPKVETKTEPKIETKPKAEPTKTDSMEGFVIEEPKPQSKPEPKVQAKPVQTAKPAAGGGGGRKILVVDDSIVIQKMVEIALENEQYELSAAMKGEDAVKSAKEVQPNLILLDMMLPDMSGLDVMKGVRDLGGDMATVPIIILSGKDSPQDKDSAISSGANDFLTKPFHDEDLLSKVHEYLSK